jgi:outer membrane protein TolC
MKKVIFLMFVTANVFAQTVDYNKIILPNHVQSPDFAEKLVQLAWQNNPLNEVYKSEIKINEYAVKRNKADWWDIVQLQGNLNEFTVNKYLLNQDEEGALLEDRSTRADFYPLYNIRASISLGMFVRIPYNRRMDKERVSISESNLDARKLELRNQVMKTYNDYLLREKIYKIQAQLFSDKETAHKLVEQKFKNGEVNFDNFYKSQADYGNAQITLLTAETDYKNTKLDLEKLIGVALEDVR